MRVLNKFRKIVLVLSVLLSLYALLILLDSWLIGQLPPYHMVTTVIVFTWLSLMYYANFVVE